MNGTLLQQSDTGYIGEQRMRNLLDLSRTVVAVLEARPRCPDLAVAVAEWDGRPSPLWRKRIVRHTRSCDVCGRAGEGMVAAERLLVGLALLPVPMAVTAALIGKSILAEAVVGATSTGAVSAAASGTGVTGAGVKAGVLAQLAQAVGAHPVAASVAAGALVVGTTITATQLPPPAPPPVVAAPTSTAPTSTAPPVVAATTAPAGAGPTTASAAPPAVPSVAVSASSVLNLVSLESANAPGKFVTTTGDFGVLAVVTADSGDAAAQRATFEVVSGLADPTCLSFRSPDGRYLRHASWRMRLHADEGTPLYRGDATFCVRPGTVEGSIWLESSNYPGWFLRHRGDELWVDHSDGSASFQADSSFVVRSPWAGSDQATR